MRSKRRWIVLVSFAFTVGFMGLVLWLGGVLPLNRDRLFRGKPESEWISNLKYNDDQQVKEWRGYGEEGVQVLIRGLKRANHPGERAYRRFKRLLPGYLQRWLPPAKLDSTQGTRMCLVSLILGLGSDARSAAPVMIRAAGNDEFYGVRQSAIGYFTFYDDHRCLLNQLPPKHKKALLPALIRAMQDSDNWGLRCNAAVALKYFPEEREAIAPTLLKALNDPQPHVRLGAAEALNRVAPDLGKKAGVTSILISISKDPDDQIAWKAVTALGHSGCQPDLAVPALVESLQNSNTLVACSAVWALEWAPKEFDSYSDQIAPALRRAAQRKDGVAGYARNALARWEPKSDANHGEK